MHHEQLQDLRQGIFKYESHRKSHYLCKHENQHNVAKLNTLNIIINNR